MRTHTNTISIQFILIGFLVLTFHLIFAGNVMGQEIHRQRFLVDGDPIPPALFLRGSAKGSGRFQKEGALEEHPFFRSGESRFDFLLHREIWDRSDFEINKDPVKDQASLSIRNRNREDVGPGNIDGEALMVPLVNNLDMLLVAGPGYMEDSFFDSKGNQLPGQLRGVYGSIFGTGSLGESFYWFSYHSAGSFSTSPSPAEKKSFKYFQITTLGWKPNDSLSLQGGVLYRNFHGDAVAIPVAGIAWGNGTVVAKLLLPLSAELRWIVRPGFHMIASASVRNSSYFVAGGDSYGSYNKSFSRSNIENRVMEGEEILQRTIPDQPLRLQDPEKYTVWDTIRKSIDSDSYYQFDREEARLGAEIRLAEWTWLQASAVYLSAERIQKKERNEWFDYGTLDPEVKTELTFIIRP